MRRSSVGVVGVTLLGGLFLGGLVGGLIGVSARGDHAGSVLAWVTALATSGAAVAAAVAARQASMASRAALDQAAIERDRREAELERDRHADLRMSIKTTGAVGLELEIENRGSCAAETVDVHIDANLGEVVDLRVLPGMLPLMSILSGERRRLPLAVLLSNDIPGWAGVRIKWKDAAGDHERHPWLPVPRPAGTDERAAQKATGLDETRRCIYMLRPTIQDDLWPASLELAGTVFNALMHHHSGLVDQDGREILTRWAARGFQLERAADLRALLSGAIITITAELGDGPAPDFPS